MGSIKFGGGVSEIRGKIGGNVYARNRGGAYQRAKTTPINPQTSLQSAQRDATSTVMRRWGATLTEAQRLAWTEAAKFISATNVFGDQLQLSGIALYSKLNNVLARIGQTLIDTVPATFGVNTLSLVSVVCDISDAKVEVSFTPLPNGTGHYLLVYTTPPLPPGRTPQKGDFSLLTNVVATTTSPYNVWTLYLARYGVTPVAGQKIGVKVALIKLANGVQSSPIYASCIVTA